MFGWIRNRLEVIFGDTATGMALVDNAELVYVPHPPKEEPVVHGPIALVIPKVSRKILKHRTAAEAFRRRDRKRRIQSTLGLIFVALGGAILGVLTGTENWAWLARIGVAGIALLGLGVLLLNRAEKL